MATRRAASSRSRTNTVSHSLQPPTHNVRPRSAMARSGSSLRSAQTEEPPLPEQSRDSQLKSSKSADDIEANIQVVIRCRRRSEREIADNSPIIVSSNGAKSQEVTIQTSAPISSLGVVTLPPTRTYPFDLVFGPEADQALIYHDVVSPMLDEVMQGYNCTLFAYGQTGTGKTYTMQGDLIPTPMGNPSTQAGMIPRVLFRLFHALESSGSDYSVKISFVELYNEELRDLLVSDLAAPAGSTQPMGRHQASKPNNIAESDGLKIFDDANKRGVFIQGLEEIPVKDCVDALALLQKGSQRRQIAATKFNDHSSRSHSIFSVTVHIKETSSMGDDLLKVGKLNLVDLAGSENIGRSGAENKRAREAGMINQSLLTLGRVINALVDRSSHVPYRESKLTRLLQDSLGGRTKTCIIATISPARCNMEETLSTLDYAIRAKSIRNKPEVNQRMTRNALLKEYVSEIERLKADLLAAREKNGIFFSEETWKEMSAEQELRATQFEEAKKQVEIVESQLRSVREEFEQSIGLLMKRDGELKDTRQKLKKREEELEGKDIELQALKTAFEEEVVVREAHQQTEHALDGIASGLREVAKDSIGDLDQLFMKLDRKASVFTSNSKSVLTHGKTIASQVQHLSAQLGTFTQASTLNVQKIRSDVQDYRSKELKILSNHSERIDRQLQRIQEVLQTIRAKDDISDKAISEAESATKQAQAALKTGFSEWSQGLSKRYGAIYGEAEITSTAALNATEKAMKGIGSTIEAIAQEVQSFVKTEREAASQAKQIAVAVADVEMNRLREQNEQLTRLLEAEKMKADKAKDELIQRVSGLLGEFTAARDQNLREAVGNLQDRNEAAESTMKGLQDESTKVVDGMIKKGEELGQSVQRRSGDGKRTREGALKGLSSVRKAQNAGYADVQKLLSESTSAYGVQIDEAMQGMGTICSSAYDRHSRAKRARIEAINTMATDAQSELRSLERGIASSSRNMESMADRVISESDSQKQGIEKYHGQVKTHLASLDQATHSLLQEGTREEPRTGSTPRKRVWEYVDQWELTQSRDKVLGSRKQETSGENCSPGNQEDGKYVADSQDQEDTHGCENDPSPTTRCDTPPELLSTIPVPLKIASNYQPSLSALANRPVNIVTRSRRAK